MQQMYSDWNNDYIRWGPEIDSQHRNYIEINQICKATLELHY